jgi:hypothetical protein
MKNRILIVSKANDSNDLLEVMKANGIGFDILHPDSVHEHNLDKYEGIMLLGGSSEEPLEIFPKDRLVIHEQIKKGKKVFAEYCRGIHNVCFTDSVSTRYERPVAFMDYPEAGLEKGDILDEQCNNRLKVFLLASKGTPILQYINNPRGFYKTDMDLEKARSKAYYALWFEHDSLLVCSFRLVNFIKAKFAPRNKWKKLIQFILKWVTGQEIDMNVADPLYEKVYRFDENTEPFNEKCLDAVNRVFEWFEINEMYDKRYDRYNSVKEGLGPAVYADGTHKREETVRSDNTGELSFAWFMRYMMTKNKECLKVSDSLSDFLLDLQVREEGPYYGMIRNGTFAWWNVCYQDDSARSFLLPKLFEMLYTGEMKYERPVRDCLDFLIRTTGKDGLRVPCTYLISPDSTETFGKPYRMHPPREDGVIRYTLDREVIRDIAIFPKVDGSTPSGHYNGWYLASLFLAYKVLGDEKYLETAKKGMSRIMAVYPFTSREHSETQELCRLILPSAMQYFATGSEEDKAFLYRVTKDLQRFKHESGAYLEWDTGYTARRSGTVGDECSLLSKNGDPVIDHLYSLNWLPVSFIQSYFVTKDPYFYTLWEDITRYFLKVQLRSEDKVIDGVWTRAFDINHKEVYGVPNDIGWAPWSVETGWTLGEIIIGIQQGLMAEELIEKYK